MMFHWRKRAAAPTASEPIDREESAAAQPRIGLALGSGAGRGWAHIGVLRSLKAAGIVPDVIAGTSVGALAGAAHAADRLEELADWATGITRRRMFGFVDLRFWSNGLIGGGRLAEALRQNFGELVIEDLPLRFAAIATEIGTGHEIWLTRGNLVEALRASYAMPGIFPPVKIAGRWLIDGAVVNPIPVSAARALGARVVIAVNLNSDLFGRGTVIQDSAGDVPVAEEANAPRRFSRVMVEAFNISQDRIARSRLAGDPPDLMISPKLGHIGLFDFHRAEEAIKAGEEATERALAELRQVVAALG